MANWTSYAVNLPKYLNDVLHVPIQKNAVYSALPRIINIGVSIFSGFISDWMHVKRGIGLTTIRKIFAALCMCTQFLTTLQQNIHTDLNFILASTLSSVFLISASYAGCDELLAVTLLTISITSQGFNTAGTILNIFDLAPNYMGPLNGLINIVSSVAALVAPYIVGKLTTNVRLMIS